MRLLSGLAIAACLAGIALAAPAAERDVVRTAVPRVPADRLGTAGTDPQGDGLDRSCTAEAQGPTRFARGLSFVAWLRECAPGVPQQVLQVPGIGHRSGAMFTSPQGLRALFGDAAGARWLSGRRAPGSRRSRSVRTGGTCRATSPCLPSPC